MNKPNIPIFLLFFFFKRKISQFRTNVSNSFSIRVYFDTLNRPKSAELFISGVVRQENNLPSFLPDFLVFPEIHDRLMTIIISSLRKNLP